MVQMNFQTVSQTKPSIALNDFGNNFPNQIRFQLVTASETNVNYFILHILSVSNSQPHQISIIRFIYWVICYCVPLGKLKVLALYQGT